MRDMAASPARRRAGHVIAALGFLAFPYCIALGCWTPDRPDLDDLRRWRSLPLFWLSLLVPWVLVAAAAHVIAAAAVWALFYAGALAAVGVRLRRRRTAPTA
jgi:hypothetical protein